jgi:hypothetical protein
VIGGMDLFWVGRGEVARVVLALANSAWSFSIHLDMSAVSDALMLRATYVSNRPTSALCISSTSANFLSTSDFDIIPSDLLTAALCSTSRS